MRKIQLFSFFLAFVLILTVISAPFVFVSADESPFIAIAGGAESVITRKVPLRIRGTEDAYEMRVAENGDFAGASWEAYAVDKEWTLSFGTGIKKVYVQFRNNEGEVSDTYEDVIRLAGKRDMVVDFRINNYARETDTRSVTLFFEYTEGVESITMSNDSRFQDAETIDITGEATWILSSGTGSKTVYVRFQDVNGRESVVQKSVRYNQPADYIREQTLIKSADGTIYYVGVRGKIHAFLNLATYHSYYPNMDDVEYVTYARLAQVEEGETLCIRQGTWLVRFPLDRSVIYAVEPACRLRRIRSVVEAHVLYGADWEKRVVELPQSQRRLYTTRGIVSVEEGAIDADFDGLSAEEEERAGTRDNKWDTDNDGVTDYEEVTYWLTDPTRADTDRDGQSDGDEIIAGQSPLGFGSLEEIPSGKVYPYPVGTVIRSGRSSYYVEDSQHIIDVSRSFKTHRFQNSFVVYPPFETNFSVSKRLRSADDMLRYPVEKIDGNLRLR